MLVDAAGRVQLQWAETMQRGDKRPMQIIYAQCSRFTVLASIATIIAAFAYAVTRLAAQPNELAAALFACPAVEDLSIDRGSHERRDSITPLEQLELIGKACPRVRRLFSASGYIRLKEKGVMRRVASSSFSPLSFYTISSSSSSTSSCRSGDNLALFTRLSHLTIATTFNPQAVAWTEAEVRRLAEVLHTAPLLFLHLTSAPFCYIHHLSLLRHLHTLVLPSEALPATGRHYFVPYSESSAGSQRCRSAADAQRAVVGELIINEEVAQEWDSKWKTARRVSSALSCVTFATDCNVGSGEVDRQAFFDTLRQTNERSGTKQR